LSNQVNIKEQVDLIRELAIEEAAAFVELKAEMA